MGRQSTYRDRMYGVYVSSGPSANNGEAEFDERRVYLQHIIRNHFPSNRDAVIIDLGCGGGAIIHFARQAGYRSMSGVDRAAEQVALAKARGIEGVREGDLLETLCSAPAASHDAVITFDVIEHFTKDELIGFADEVARVLKPGGRWIIHVPNAESPFGARVRYADFTHELAFTRTSMAQYLGACGFREVHCFEETPIPHGVKSMARWLIWKFIRGVLRVYLAAETGETGCNVVLTQNLLAVGFR